ncbi:hypothetical protein N7471_000286 [Penicillium samsonianum]|uniref:uncharacterized protein n=1 Tax=Penicillium samsonianum TaxID=1882272 RepID=UPI0025468D52|nr:uncharacterized protein N7471_000286 [Penicillium samsonianum]KAJ6149087.1 hypothetical protein N7471_000286 [Penicillium samsonianum]
MSDPSELGAAMKLRKAALGYLRTYFYLIQYESDLRIAQDPALFLVPKEMTWPWFCQFTAHFHDITDNEVSGRYHYGEIRLSRLNGSGNSVASAPVPRPSNLISCAAAMRWQRIRQQLISVASARSTGGIAESTCISSSFIAIGI